MRPRQACRSCRRWWIDDDGFDGFWLLITYIYIYNNNIIRYTSTVVPGRCIRSYIIIKLIPIYRYIPNSTVCIERVLKQTYLYTARVMSKTPKTRERVRGVAEETWYYKERVRHLGLTQDRVWAGGWRRWRWWMSRLPKDGKWFIYWVLVGRVGGKS